MRFDSFRFDRIRCVHARGRYHFARASSVRPPSYPVIPRAKTTHDTTAAKTVSAFRLPGVISRRRRRRPTGVSREGHLSFFLYILREIVTYCTRGEHKNVKKRPADEIRTRRDRCAVPARQTRARRIHGERTRRRSRENVDAIRGRVVHRSIVRRVRRERAVERARA